MRRLLMPLSPSPVGIPLSNCPPELIERVATFLPRKDFCNLRLVNRKINCATVHLFVRENFRKFDIDFTQEGLQKLADISQHYDLTGEVNFGAWIQDIRLRQAVWSDREEGAWKLALTTKRARKQRRIIEDGARNAAVLWQSHLEMDAGGHYRQMLITILQRMKRLIAVSVLGHLDTSLLAGNKLHVLLKNYHGFSQPAVTVYVPTIPESAERFAFTLKTIFAAMAVSSAHLSVRQIRLEFPGLGDGGPFITLAQLSGIIDSHEALHGGPSHAWKFLETCNTLEIGFFKEEGKFPSLVAQASFRRFIPLMGSSLSFLQLQGYNGHYDEALLPVVHQLAQGVHFPKLKDLDLDRASMHSADLETFVHRHASTLATITLFQVRLDSGGWRRFLSNLLICAIPNLSCFWVFNVYESDISRQEDGSYQIGEPSWVIWPDRSAKKADEWLINELGAKLKPYRKKGPERLRWLAARVETCSPYS